MQKENIVGQIHNSIYQNIQKKGFVAPIDVLMDNHVHLIVRMKELEPWHAMKYLNNKYSKFYNKKYHRNLKMGGLIIKHK